ncbi:hypothetical protein JOQ06_002138, partial [Pogonophryne albipinna]
MTKPESRKSGVAAMSSTGKCATSATAQVNDGAVEPGCPDHSAHIKANVMKQTSRESMNWRNCGVDCEVYDDGTNTFFCLHLRGESVLSSGWCRALLSSPGGGERSL